MRSLALLSIGRFCLVGLWMPFVSSLLLAQITTGIISGTVTDETGAVLPGVTITVRNTETGITQTVVTDDSGRYSVSQLALGTHEVEADLTGFRPLVRSGITLTVGREAVVNMRLSVGEITEKVEIGRASCRERV